MGSVFFVLCLVARLCYWDLQLKLRMAIRYRWAKRYADLRIHHMAEALFRLARVYLKLRIVIEKDPELKLPDHFLVVSNHQSVVDIVAVKLALAEYPVRFVAKKELGKWFPAVSAVLRVQRHALIDRHGRRDETMRELDRLARRSRHGTCPVIFAEGTRSRTGEVLPFQAGAIRRLLSISPLPIVAIAIDGGHQFSRILEISARARNAVYRTRVLRVYPMDTSKSGVLNTVKQAEHAIREQIEEWHRA